MICKSNSSAITLLPEPWYSILSFLLPVFKSTSSFSLGEPCLKKEEHGRGVGTHNSFLKIWHPLSSIFSNSLIIFAPWKFQYVYSSTFVSCIRGAPLGAMVTPNGGNGSGSGSGTGVAETAVVQDSRRILSV
jgi:hypothetical protein